MSEQVVPSETPLGRRTRSRSCRATTTPRRSDQFVVSVVSSGSPRRPPAPGSTFGRNYSVDYPAQAPLARFIMTSPGLGSDYTAGSPLYQWLSSTIDQARASGIRWVIVGNHFNHITMATKISEVPAAYFDLLVSKKVDLILQSHDHTYQRSKQLAHGAACPVILVNGVDGDCVVDDGSDGTYVAGQGPVLVIAGSGGVSLYNVNTADSEAGYFATSMGANQQATYGYTQFTVSESSISSQFVPTSGGPFRDSFSIVGGSVPDTSAPSVPGGVAAQVVSGGVQVSWSASSDDRGVAGYRVVRDGAVIADAVAGTSYLDAAVVAGTTYAYQVRALDAAGNVSAASAPVSVTTPATPPGLVYAESWSAADGAGWPAAWATQAVQGLVDVQSGAGRLRFENVSGSYARALLSGPAAEADTDLVTSYRWGETSPRAYLNVFVRGSGGWQNAYRPLNGYGLELSSDSRAVLVRRNVNGVSTTLATVGTGQQLTTAKQWLRLRVQGNAISFRIWSDGTPEPTTWAWSGTDSTVTAPGRLHLSLVRSSASTTAKNVFLDDLTLTRAGGSVPDTSAPSVPGGVAAQVVSGGVQVSWSASSDDRGVAGYRVVRDGAVIADAVAGTSYLDAAVVAGTTYAYQVRALDAAGNVSAASAPVSVTTPATPPGLVYAESWSAADGAGWPAAWATQAVQGLVDVQSGAGRLRFENVSGSYARALLSGPAAEADTDLVTSYRWGETSPRAYLNVFVRGSGGWQNAYRPLNGYGLELSSDSRAVLVRRNVNGVSTTLATVGTGQQLTTAKQWLRLRVQGNAISFRIWSDGTPEPTTWAWSGTDSTVTAPGRLHLSLVRSSASTTAKNVFLDDLTLTRAGA